MIGLGISQSISMLGIMQLGMVQFAEIIDYMASVERILEYTQLEKERPQLTAAGKFSVLFILFSVIIPLQDERPSASWPSKGAITFRNLVLRYVENQAPVLRGLNLEIFPSEKIGIVGRTGAGKSSLVAALFRLAPIEGEILIDGVDTKTLILKDLREKLSIIPQEPVLFPASMRFNLDPFNEFNDEKLWNVLEEVELKNEIPDLDFMVIDGGSNFSLGQRQLICLARAILRNKKILILDEATANVDPKTDQLIQKTIRRKFGHCTVLTIAHRLHTIMDSDRVLVMDSGNVVEFDHPYILLQNYTGYFSRMLMRAGPEVAHHMRNIAQEAYESRFITTHL
ncbi:hypothetical protein HHI36_006589 [Cryptolaemus montrouzieri]|uniref:ABC transporter domain-containing protein n=1 Tax=Cryptolaemus montrouzieri TaxID=559131 RepID=A0ABD2NXI4_9CUCU